MFRCGAAGGMASHILLVDGSSITNIRQLASYEAITMSARSQRKKRQETIIIRSARVWRLDESSVEIAGQGLISRSLSLAKQLACVVTSSNVFAKE